MRKSQSLTGNIDWVLVGLYAALMTMGVATIYSVAYDPEHPSLFDFSQMYGRQIMWVCVSLFLGFLVFLIDSDIYRKFALPIYISVISLLVIVLFMPPVNGARAWLGIGSMGIQPAEFAKIGTAILLARYISSLNPKQQSVRSVIFANLILLVPMALILIQPDAGTFIVFTSFLFVMYREGLTYDPIVLRLVNIIPGVKFKETWVGSHFIPILFVVVFISVVSLLMSNTTITFDSIGLELRGIYGVLFFLFVLVLIGYLIMRMILSRRERRRALIIAIMAYLFAGGLSFTVDYGFQKLADHQKDRIELVLGLKEDPDGEDYNRNRAMAAVGSGGLMGKGYRKASVSSVRTNHVPESETDFIFCPYAEEWGFVGTFVLVVLYISLLLKIIQIAERQRSKFNRVYAYSVAMILFYHFAINIGMNIEFAPVIGIPLPFFSYGGSSMMSFSILMFILLKLDSQRKDVLN